MILQIFVPFLTGQKIEPDPGEEEQESPFFPIGTAGRQQQQQDENPFQAIGKEGIPSTGRKDRPTIRQRAGKAERIIEGVLGVPFEGPLEAIEAEREAERQAEEMARFHQAQRDFADPTFFARKKREEEFFKTLGQAQGVFAPDILGDVARKPTGQSLVEIIGEVTPGALPLLLGGPSLLLGVITGDEEARALFDPDIPLAPPQNLEEVINNNIQLIPPGLPFGVSIEPGALLNIQRGGRPRELIQPPIFSTGGGVLGDVFRSMRAFDDAMTYDPFGTTLQFVTAPLVLTYLGFFEMLQNTAIAGPDAGPRRIRIETLRDRFIDSVGRMTPQESEEARRGFMALLATGAYGYAVRAGLGPGTALRNLRSRRIVRARSGQTVGETFRILSAEDLNLGATAELRAAGLRGVRPPPSVSQFKTIQDVLNFAEAQSTTGTTLFRIEQIERFLNMAGGLATFGTFIAEPGEKLSRAITFTLGAVPLYAMYGLLGWVGSRYRVPPSNVGWRGRASQLNNMRSARPFDDATGPIPDVRTDIGNIPFGPEPSVSAPARIGPTGDPGVTGGGGGGRRIVGTGELGAQVEGTGPGMTVPKRMGTPEEEMTSITNTVVLEGETTTTMDSPEHPDFAPRLTVVETARAQQQRIEQEGIPNPSPVPSTMNERRDISDAARRSLFDEQERRRKPVGATLEDVTVAIGERVDLVLSTLVDAQGNLLPPDITERLSSNDLIEAVSKALSIKSVRALVTQAVGDFTSEHITRETIIETLTLEISRTGINAARQLDLSSGRRQGERRDLVRDAEKREISIVKNDLIELLAIRGVRVRGDFFQIIGSENFIRGYLAHEGSPTRQTQILKDILREHFPESQLTDIEVSTLANDVVLELNTSIQARRIGQLNDLAREARAGGIQPQRPDVLGEVTAGGREGVERRVGEGRRGGEVEERRRSIIPLHERPEGIGLINEMPLLALRQARGNAILARQNLVILLEAAKATGDFDVIDTMTASLKLFDETIGSAQQVNTFLGFPTTTRRFPAGLDQLDIAAFEATRLKPDDLEALAAGREIVRVQIASDIIGDTALAADWVTMNEISMGGTLIESIEADRRIAEIEKDLTPAQLRDLRLFRGDEFGINGLLPKGLRDLATVKRNWDPVRLQEDATDVLLLDLLKEIEAPLERGFDAAASLIKQIGIFQTLNGRGMSPQEIGVGVQKLFINQFGMSPEGAKALSDDGIERIERAGRRLANVPRRIDFPGNPKPLVPSDIAENLANWLNNEGDPVGALLDQVRNKPGQIVIVRGEATPGNTLALAVDKLANDFDVVVHERPDGLFDLAVIGPGSPLQLEIVDAGVLRRPLRDQFVNEGRFRGQRISILGTDVEYVGVPIDPKTRKPDANNIIVRSDKYIHAKNPKGEITVARSIARDVRDVESINEFDRVASSQRGLPEQAAQRIKDTQISQVYQWLTEYTGDLTRLMSEGIIWNKGNFNDVLLSIDRLIKEMEPLEDLLVRVNREVAENSLVKTNPIVPVNVLTEVRASVTGDPETLSPVERRDLTRLQILGRDYAAFHAEIPVINRVQRLAQSAAIALGEFKFEEALEALKALQGELGKGRANWEVVTANSTTPSIREVIEQHLDPEEVETWDRMVRELQPPTARKLLESGEEFSFDRVREAANTNGMVLEINTSGTYVLRGKDRGYELFASPNIRGIVDFMRNSGQAQGLDMDAAHDVDPDVPGSVQPPTADPPRNNEPMPFPPGRLIEMMLEGVTAIFPFAAPFKDWSAGFDALNGTEIHKLVWLATNAKAFEAAALSASWINFQKKTGRTDPGLKDIEKMLRNAGFKTKEQREMANRYLNALSRDEVMDLLNTDGKAIVRLLESLIPQGATAKTALTYIEDLRTELRKAAGRMGFGDDITKVPDLTQKEIAARLQREKPYTPVDVGVAKFFTEIAKRKHSELNFPIIIRAFEASRTGALSRADFAAANKFTAEQISALAEIDAFMERIVATKGVKITNLALLRAYQGNYAWLQTIDPADAYLRQKDIDPELAFVNSTVRMGESAAYLEDPISVAAKFAQGAANQATGSDLAWDGAQKYTNTLPKGSLGRMVAESYLGAVRGNLPAITREVENIVNTIFKELGWKVPTTSVRNMVNGMLALMSSAAISLRPGLTVRDLTTAIVQHYARFGGSPIKGQGILRKSLESVGLGPTRTIRMLELGFSNIWGTRKELVNQGIVPSVGPIRFETPSELLSSNLGKGIGRLPNFMQDLANWGFLWGGQKTMYEVMFTGTLLESREFVGKASTMFQSGEVTKSEFYNIIKLDAFQRVVQAEFDGLITAEKWEQATELLSRQSAIDILGLYGMGNHPWGWGTNTGKLFGHFGIWPVSAAQQVLGGLTRGKKNSIPILNQFVSGRQVGFATRLVMTQAAFYVGGRALGMDFYRWLLFPGIFFTGGPTVQMAQDIANIINGSDDDRRRAISSLKNMLPEVDLDDMRNTDIRSMFFPFSYIIGDIQQGLKARENGEPWPGVLGRFFAVPLSDKPSWLDSGSSFFFQEE
jgi:hypothetical protein